MKYTESRDGVKRASVRVIVRIDQETVSRIRRAIRARHGGSGTDKQVREFVESCNDIETILDERLFDYLGDEEA